MKNKRSLYMCGNAKVIGKRIVCVKGHKLSRETTENLTISVDRLARGEPLVFAVCQNCWDYDEFGPPVPKQERGWLKLQSPAPYLGNTVGCR